MPEGFNKLDGLPAPRALVGSRTDLPFEESSNSTDRLYKISGLEKTPLHFTVEYVERSANVRFARTYFLNNLSTHYMKGYQFTDDEDLMAPSELGRTCEMDTRLLFNAYFSLILAYKQVSEQYLMGAFGKSEDLSSQAKSLFEKSLASRLNLSDNELQRLFGKYEFTAHAIEYNAYGRMAGQTGEEEESKKGKSSGHNMIMVRMQAKGLCSLESGETLGSVLYADSFFQIQDDIGFNLT